MVWRAILNLARGIIEDTLRTKQIHSYDLDEFRWGIPDFTFSWPKREDNGSPGGRYCNLHCWVEGRWPSYLFHIEAATWLDQNSERRVVFVPSKSFQVSVTGTFEQPSVEFDIKPGIVGNVIDSVRAADPDAGQVFALDDLTEGEQY